MAREQTFPIVELVDGEVLKPERLVPLDQPLMNGADELGLTARNPPSEADGRQVFRSQTGRTRYFAASILCVFGRHNHCFFHESLIAPIK